MRFTFDTCLRNETQFERLDCTLTSSPWYPTTSRLRSRSGFSASSRPTSLFMHFTVVHYVALHSRTRQLGRRWTTKWNVRETNFSALINVLVIRNWRITNRRSRVVSKVWERKAENMPSQEPSRFAGKRGWRYARILIPSVDNGIYQILL